MDQQYSYKWEKADASILSLAKSKYNFMWGLCDWVLCKSHESWWTWTMKSDSNWSTDLKFGMFAFEKLIEALV